MDSFTKSSGDSNAEAPATPAEPLSSDDLLLRAQGHEAELPRQFSLITTLGLSFAITNSWAGFSSVFVFPLLAGGGPTVIFGLIVAFVACSFITAGLAELASAYPSTGGQYHFAFMVSSPKYRTPTAFFLGWFSILAWIAGSTSAANFSAQIIVQLAAFYHEDYVVKTWHVYLIFVLITAISVLFVVALPKALPMLDNVLLLTSLCGFVAFFITVLATSTVKQTPEVVFATFTNVTGWNDGVAFLLGVGSAMYAFLSIDSATHLAEEIPDPGRNVPKVMGMTMLLGGGTAIPWALAFMFSTTDLDAITVAGIPIFEVFKQALNNSAGATFMVCWLTFIFVGATIACVATTGRLTWAFARDNGLPFSSTFAKVDSKLETPVNATIVVGVVQIIYGVLYIASTTAFNSLISMSIISLNITYAVPQGIVLIRGRSKVLPQRYLELGPYLGPFCNAFSVLWVSAATVFFCLPSVLPAEVGNMNYVSVVLAGITVIVAFLWFSGKKDVFVGPNVFVEGVEVADTRHLAEHAREVEKGDSSMA